MAAKVNISYCTFYFSLMIKLAV
uniref:Uncharacterized protein n=1 Tax=Anguilla anguilla TaxID=7936 RepID=A0A0E9PBM5_ANGAN